MPIIDLDHVNLRSAHLGEMVAFYRDLLGLSEGPRPPFSFDGAWLYIGEKPALHLVAVETSPSGREPRIEHFAFRAVDFPTYRERLKAAGVPHRLSTIPETGMLQIHTQDPDGNHVEINFAAEEAPAAD